ncbi:MAG: hypothetical protein COX29_01770 [Candidatus Moranbacteria bacterium CG23_combo_of_CG06-09_8_20_14_all_35_22]|nr:MAG: hypothetical protein COX29_01770 [Candidatus Moranbacteria bacterium CG23_combo_of_CG06-09_8_20_14_all_35_22]
MTKNKIKNLEITHENDKKSLFLDLLENLLSGLNSRSKEIIQRRFGLLNREEETLDKIGKRYNITRERVRQIIFEALKNISAKVASESFLKAEEKIIFTINKNNGIIPVSEIAKKFDLDGEKEINAIRFFVLCSEKIKEVQEKELFEKVWTISEDIISEIKSVLSEAQINISQENKLFTDEEILKLLLSIFPNFSKEKILNFLGISAKIKKNKFGKWGMKNWAQVSPKGTKERVHLVLKEYKQPLHFTQIAQLIDKFELSKRKAHPQTVHNELIKDERFVLIGRGIYALKEWGYFEGTIQEVIKSILQEKNKPLKKEEIIEEVLKIRKVKKTTISINLNNIEMFERKSNLYMLKK